MPSATDWISALATALAALVAVVAALYARQQWRETRSAREDARLVERERSQPYVAAYADTRGADIELVVKNFGPTAAREVRIQLNAPLERATAVHDPSYATVELPSIGFLAPDAEWRTWWDNGPARVQSMLPKRYEGTVSYLGLDKEPRSSEVVLDLTAIQARIYSTEAASLRDIVRVLERILSVLKRPR